MCISKMSTVGDNEEDISIRLLGLENDINHFKIKSCSPLECLMEKYCLKTGIQQSNVLFFHKRTRIRKTDTLLSLGIGALSVIEVHEIHFGG
ncbi:small ubiquitin-related modifier 1-like [Melanaphis sacchari]|uniref:small ubiquitin-related modifier 1-like n=1 Tax=Melanaphis sacchari TaxID=742174 RepID=UPI000DC12F13|nr:small ubiquitin-related modifier 1-like [Melanaphis sacchari]